MISEEYKEIEIGRYFIDDTVYDEFARELLQKVIFQILQFSPIGYSFRFQSIDEQLIENGKIVDTNDSGSIYINPEKLKICDENVVLALIGNVLAHVFKRHYQTRLKASVLENLANEKAKEWGFDIDAVEALRKAIEPPTLVLSEFM